MGDYDPAETALRLQLAAALADLKRERDQRELVDGALRDAVAERDELRAVVRRAQQAWIRHTTVQDAEEDGPAFAEWTAAWEALRSFDASERRGRIMVRILDPADEFHLRLGLVMSEDDDRFGVWIDGHPVDFVHWVQRSLTQGVPGTWHDLASGRGEWFIAEDGAN